MSQEGLGGILPLRNCQHGHPTVRVTDDQGWSRDFPAQGKGIDQFWTHGCPRCNPNEPVGVAYRAPS